MDRLVNSKSGRTLVILDAFPMLFNFICDTPLKMLTSCTCTSRCLASSVNALLACLSSSIWPLNLFWCLDGMDQPLKEMNERLLEGQISHLWSFWSIWLYWLHPTFCRRASHYFKPAIVYATPVQCTAHYPCCDNGNLYKKLIGQCIDIYIYRWMRHVRAEICNVIL